MDKLIKTENKDYSIDPRTGMVINTNMERLAQIKERRQSERRMRALENDISLLKQEIKALREKIENGIYDKSN